MIPPRDPRAHRVVSLSPLASRFVVAIGAAHLLVAVDAESARLPELEGLPVVDAQGLESLSPDLVLLAELPADNGLEATPGALVVFNPHNIMDVVDLCRALGSRLVGDAGASIFETRISRPLAMVGGSSYGQARPRVIAVVGFDPLELAGGHSFETDLIEIAGGTSATHDRQEARFPVRLDRLRELAPDLVLVVTPAETTPEQRRAALDALPAEYPVEFFAFDRERFWLLDAAEPARRLRAVIEPISRDLESTAR